MHDALYAILVLEGRVEGLAVNLAAGVLHVDDKHATKTIASSYY
jgi:hypothetical protein